MYDGCGTRRHGSDILLGAALGYVVATSWSRCGRGSGDLSGLFTVLVVVGLLTAGGCNITPEAVIVRGRWYHNPMPIHR
jgi:hypothetical protein